MKLRDLHSWSVTPREAIAIQRQLAAQISRRGRVGRVRRIGGVDISVDRARGRGRGAVVVLSYPALELLEVIVAETELTFPYVPGLLSFRETPVLRAAFERLREPVDLLLVDGHGYAHPRRFGIACHLGLLLDVPAVGVGKSRLVGEHEEPAPEAGSRADLTHQGEVIGGVLRTRAGVKPVYISVGHRISLAAAERWALHCCRGYRLPEPVRLAHQAAGGTLRSAMMKEQSNGRTQGTHREPGRPHQRRAGASLTSPS
jgi:deoxyribonuclease V